MATSRADAIAFLDLAAATENPSGIAVEVPNFASAIAFRQALHRTRAEARKESTEFADPGDPGYNKSRWEHITCRVVQHPRKNLKGSNDLPFLIVATSSEHLMRSLQLVDPITGDPLEDAAELLETEE